MHRNNSIKRVLLTLGFLSAFVFSSVNAFAWMGDERGPHHGREVVVVGHDRYHYRDGRFFHLGWFGLEFAIMTPPVGATITILPSGHKVMRIQNVTYYYYDNVYYQACPSGYVVVPAPVVPQEAVIVPAAATVAAPVQASVTSATSSTVEEPVVVHISNAAGGYTKVTLTKCNKGYLGPQGEFYPGNPTVEQLKVLYGN